MRAEDGAAAAAATAKADDDDGVAMTQILKW